MEGSLSRLVLPQTIDDAIVACMYLNIDYLWVDRLCILQDDDPDKKSYWLNSMGDIYAQSYVTIIALDGDDAEHGLPGVNMVKRTTPWIQAAQDIYLLLPPPYYDQCLRDSKWSTRGWTFQEGMLATRRLVFSDTRVFYEYSYPRTVQDETYGSYPRNIQDEIYGSYDKLPMGDGLTLGSYYCAMVEFTRRKLTCESDVLRAFAGVLRTRWGPNTYYGIPLAIFSHAILWTSESKSYSTRNAASGDVFPTWSWSSTLNQITFSEVVGDDLGLKKVRASLATWAIPSKLNQGPALRIVANTLGEPEELDELDELKSLNRRDEETIPPSERIKDEQQISLATLMVGDKASMIKMQCQRRSREFMRLRLAVLMAWRCGCFSGTLPEILNTTTTWKEYENIASQWRSLGQLCDEAHGMPWGKMSEQDQEMRFPLSMRQDSPPGSIFVYTQSVSLNPLKLSLKNGYFEEDRLVIEVDDFVAQVNPGSINLERVNHVRQQNLNSQFELLALSVTHKDLMRPWRFEIKEEEEELLKDEDYWYDSAGEPLGGLISGVPFQIELMLVETENGVSRRVGLAWAFLKHWINRNPQHRTFHLV